MVFHAILSIVVGTAWGVFSSMLVVIEPGTWHPLCLACQIGTRYYTWSLNKRFTNLGLAAGDTPVPSLQRLLCLLAGYAPRYRHSMPEEIYIWLAGMFMVRAAALLQWAVEQRGKTPSFFQLSVSVQVPVQLREMHGDMMPIAQ
jgi:hypothetical protein